VVADQPKNLLPEGVGISLERRRGCPLAGEWRVNAVWRRHRNNADAAIVVSKLDI